VGDGLGTIDGCMNGRYARCVKSTPSDLLLYRGLLKLVRSVRKAEKYSNSAQQRH